MREIKFRAWDKGLNEMTYSGLHSIGFDGKVYYGNADFSDYGLEIMQYTGLKDKNGKEVYEGDIVSVWRDGSNRKFAVKWRESGVPMFILYPQPLNENFWHCRSDMEMAWEVIGNIFEDGDLLNGTHEGTTRR